MQPSNIDKNDIVKYVVPYKSVKHSVSEDVKEWRIVDEKTRKVEEVVVGRKKVEKVKELIPDVPFADAILKYEKGGKKLLGRKVILDLKGNIKHIK